MMFLFYIVVYAYAIAMLYLIYGFSRLTVFKEDRFGPKTRFTIVVPFRDEAQNLPKLLESLSKLNYPMDYFEVILVDDGSLDGYAFPERSVPFSVQVVANKRISGSPKKDAILTAIHLAKNEWIITTDADCVVKYNWLLAFDNMILKETGLEMIAGGVVYNRADSFLHKFQQLDLASLQGVTIGSFGWGQAFMCNGANFAYTKSFFEKLGGFDGNGSFAGGDDVFLLQKAVAQFPKKVSYLKSGDAIVVTKPAEDWQNLFFQRVRWAAKTSGYQSKLGKFLAVLVFLTNACWVLSFALWVFSTGYFEDFITLSAVKFAADYIVISQANRFLRKKVQGFIRSSFLYPFFSTFVALYAMIGQYDWKGRKFRK